MSTLVIVESPTKAKSLRQYLGSGYVVRASLGHVRDLPPKALGVAVEAGFAPTYRLLPRARKTLAELRLAIAGSEAVLLATDPDREGEAIAWHVAQACAKELAGKLVRRARFHEITPGAVKAAIAQPGALDMRLVDAQQARRILDRLVGYGVSPVLWKGIDGPPGLSAGRVQSVALRLVVERDREIEAFVPDEYWTLDSELSRQELSPTEQSPPEGAHFRARLHRIAKNKPDLKSEADAQTVVEALQGADWRVGEVNRAVRSRRPYPPYITSTLQRDGSARLHWPAKKVMLVAQQLYEGVSLPGEGQAGLITYMRTDSTHVAPQAQREAREVVERLYGAEALPASPPVYTKKVKNAQEAHEAIRPTRPDRLPVPIRGALTPDQDKLYTLIWRRFIASQMKPAVYNVTTVSVLTSRGRQELPYIFRATGRELIDPGFLRVYDLEAEPLTPEALAGQDLRFASADSQGRDSIDNAQLPPLAAGDALRLHRLLPAQHFTSPPPYFTDAALIQELERLGIGRPSTFAAIVDTLYERRYVAKFERALASTELGRAVCDFLVKHFPSVFAVDFTARMEDRLDDIANGEAEWTMVMSELWAPLSALVAKAEAAVAGQPKIRVKGIEAGPRKAWKGKGRKGTARNPGARNAAGRKATVRTTGAQDTGTRPTALPNGEPCPKCGQPLVRRTGKFGPFIGCSGFPKCRYIARPKKGTPTGKIAE